MTKNSLVACLALLTVCGGGLGGPAAAQDLQGFQAPSHNIFCLVEQGDSSTPTDLRCDLQTQTARSFAYLRGCQEDSGDSFAVTQNGAKGYEVCHGDTVRIDTLQVVPYGQTWRGAGFTCMSAPTGITCSNAGGHGFFVSKASQKVF